MQLLPILTVILSQLLGAGIAYSFDNTQSVHLITKQASLPCLIRGDFYRPFVIPSDNVTPTYLEYCTQITKFQAARLMVPKIWKILASDTFQTRPIPT